MATKIKIGHASIGEDGLVSGGAAGDPSGNEVCIRENYDITNLNPNVLLRPKTKVLAEASAKACEDGCNNKNIGYSQSTRNTLYNLAKVLNYDLSKVGLCNTDCSAFLSVCAIAGGARISYGTNAPTTRTMRNSFKQSGDYTVLTDAKHLTMTDYLKRGDILVKEGRHTLMVLENGSDYIEDDQEQPDTSVTDVRIKYIDVTVSAVTATTATVNIRAIERKTGVADKLLNEKVIRGYSWTYTVESLAKNNTQSKTLALAANGTTINLIGLLPGTSYLIQVVATKKGNKELCSSKVLFTTTSTSKPERVNKQFNFTRSNIKSIYLRVNDKYKQVTAYDKIEE